jgi:hypothetical protein
MAERVDHTKFKKSNQQFATILVIWMLGLIVFKNVVHLSELAF